MSASSSLNVNVLWPKPSPLPSLRSPTLPPFIHPSFITPQPSLHPHLSVFFFTFGIAHFGGQIGLLKWKLFSPTYTNTDLKRMEVLS